MDAADYSCYARLDGIRATNQRTNMVLLLSVVSFLLVVGGGAAAVYGADTIRTETGSTLAVVGVAMACAGLLMAALVACLSELRKIRESLEAGEALRAIPQTTFPSSTEPALAPVTAAAVAAAVVAADRAPAEALRAPEAVSEPSSPPKEPEPAAPEAPHADVAPHVEVAPLPLRPTIVPDVDHEKRETVTGDPEPPAHVPADEDMRADLEPGATPAAPAASERPGEVAAEAAQPVSAEAPAMDGPKARELVATYASGEHTYFMYSDSAIEADTPQGRFRFASMEELRVFVETGTGGMPLSPPAPRKPD